MKLFALPVERPVEKAACRICTRNTKKSTWGMLRFAPGEVGDDRLCSFGEGGAGCGIGSRASVPLLSLCTLGPLLSSVKACVKQPGRLKCRTPGCLNGYKIKGGS